VFVALGSRPVMEFLAPTLSSVATGIAWHFNVVVGHETPNWTWPNRPFALGSAPTESWPRCRSARLSGVRLCVSIPNPSLRDLIILALYKGVCTQDEGCVGNDPLQLGVAARPKTGGRTALGQRPRRMCAGESSQFSQPGGSGWSGWVGGCLHAGDGVPGKAPVVTGRVAAASCKAPRFCSPSRSRLGINRRHRGAGSMRAGR
jgi:hypothetical protein